MAFFKTFIAALLFLTAIMANPVPAPTTVSEISIPAITLPYTTVAAHTIPIPPFVVPTDFPTGLSVGFDVRNEDNSNRLSCNNFGCGLKCKSTIQCNTPLTPQSCPICAWFDYTSGAPVEKWDWECLAIQWGYQAAKKC